MAKNSKNDYLGQKKGVVKSLEDLKTLTNDLNLPEGDNIDLDDIDFTPEPEPDILNIDLAPEEPQKSQPKVVNIATKLEEVERKGYIGRDTSVVYTGTIVDVVSSSAKEDVSFIKISAMIDGKTSTYVGHRKYFKPKQKFERNQIITFNLKPYINKENKPTMAAYNMEVKSNKVSKLLSNVIEKYSTAEDRLHIFTDNQMRGTLAEYCVKAHTVQDVITQVEKYMKLKLVGLTSDAQPKYCFKAISS